MEEVFFCSGVCAENKNTRRRRILFSFLPTQSRVLVDDTETTVTKNVYILLVFLFVRRRRRRNRFDVLFESLKKR